MRFAIRGFKRLDYERVAALALLAVAALFNYRQTFIYTMAMFAEPLEDMSHGWLIPFFTLYLLWQRRKELRASAGAPSWAGVAWTVFFLALAWFGGRGGQSRIEQVSLIGLIWAVPFAFWGRGVERQMRLPAAYLLFTVPVSSFVDFFTIHLRIFSSALATGILNGVGLAIQRTGTAIYSKVPGAEFNIDVADPCSGIRSLFAMMALTAAYASLTQKTTGRKWLLFGFSVPIAMVGNMARIMTICLVAVWFGQDVAVGYYHDYSGYVVFLVGVLLMVKTGDLIAKYSGAVSRFLRRGEVGDREKHEPAASTAAALPAADARPGRSRLAVYGVTLAGLVVFCAKLMMPPPVYDQEIFVSQTLPETVRDFTGDVPWFCHNPQCLEVTEERMLVADGAPDADGFKCTVCGNRLHKISLGEKSDLPKDTIIVKRNYRSGDGLGCSVSLVIGGHSRNSLHRAELCLPAQGFTMLQAQRMTINLGDGKPLIVRKILARRAGSPEMTLVYWFKSRERETSSHTRRILLDVWDRSVHNRINRWVMVAISINAPLDDPERIERFSLFLSELYPKITELR